MASTSSRTRRDMGEDLEDFAELQRLGPRAPVPAPEVLGQPLTDDRQRDGDIGEAHDVVAAVRLLTPGDALGRERGATEPTEDGIVGGDLNRGLVRRGIDVAVARPDAGRRDLQEVLGYAAAQED